MRLAALVLVGLVGGCGGDDTMPEPCGVGYTCPADAACVKLHGDSAPRCWPSCGYIMPHECDSGGWCVRIVSLGAEAGACLPGDGPYQWECVELTDYPTCNPR